MPKKMSVAELHQRCLDKNHELLELAPNVSIPILMQCLSCRLISRKKIQDLTRSERSGCWRCRFQAEAFGVESRRRIGFSLLVGKQGSLKYKLIDTFDSYENSHSWMKAICLDCSELTRVKYYSVYVDTKPCCRPKPRGGGYNATKVKRHPGNVGYVYLVASKGKSTGRSMTKVGMADNAKRWKQHKGAILLKQIRLANLQEAWLTEEAIIRSIPTGLRISKEDSPFKKGYQEAWYTDESFEADLL